MTYPMFMYLIGLFVGVGLCGLSHAALPLVSRTSEGIVGALTLIGAAVAWWIWS